MPHGKNTYTFSGAAHISRYEWVRQYVTKMDCLEIGSGSGYGANLLSNHVHFIDAIDISKISIDYARETFKSNNVNYFVADMSNEINLQKKYDVIITFDVVEHVGGYANFFKNAANHLKENGLFICGTPNKLQTLAWNSDWNPYHINEFTPSELQSELAKYFRSVRLTGQDIADHKHKKLLQSRIRTKKTIYIKLKRIIKESLCAIARIRNKERVVLVSDITFEGSLNNSFGLKAICADPVNFKS